MKPYMITSMMALLLSGSVMGTAAAAGEAGGAMVIQTSRTAHMAGAYRLRHLDGGDGLWSASMLHWTKISGGKSHSGASVIGYDWKSDDTMRTGAFLSYESGEYAGEIDDDVKDYRVGIIHAGERGAESGFLYADYGWQRHKLTGADRRTTRAAEAGGEYQYNLWQGREDGWCLSPYVNGQISRITGDDLGHTYGAGELGLEIRRKTEASDYAARVGYKRILTGSALSIGGDTANVDTNYLIAGLYGTAPLFWNWKIGGDLYWEKGNHDESLAAIVTLSREW